MADEDVVFVNSPLYEHLAGVGFTDFEAETLDISIARTIDESTTLPKCSGVNTELSRYFVQQYYVQRMMDFCGFVWTFVIPCSLSKQISYQLSYISVLKESGLLTEDDLEFVYKFEQCNDSASISGSNKNGASNESKTHKLLQGSASCEDKLGSNYVIVFVVVFAMLLWVKTSYQPIVVLVLVLFGMLLVAKGYKAWSNYSMDQQHCNNVTTINSYFQLTNAFLALVRKSILFIQEKELLAHGHIFISSKLPDPRLGRHQTSGPTCLMLRECILTEAKLYIDVLQAKTNAIASSQLFKDTKILTWLKKHLLQLDTLKKTDNSTLDKDKFSLTELKKIRANLINWQSLLLCYAILKSYSVVHSLNQSNGGHFDLIQNCFYDLLKPCKDCLDKIKCCYIFHKAEVPGHRLDATPSQSEISKMTSPFVSAVHSMTLHLQELCRLSVGIEGKMDSLKDIALREYIVENHSEFEKDLSSVKHGLESITSCCEESCSRLQEMLLVNNTPENEIKAEMCDMKAATAKLADKDIQVLSIFENSDTMPDQVFEGVTSSDINDKSTMCGLTQQEHYAEQKAVQESKHLLQELKSVLATRGEEKMVSIPKALLLKKSEESCSLEEQSDQETALNTNTNTLQGVYGNSQNAGSNLNKDDFSHNNASCKSGQTTMPQVLPTSLFSNTSQSACELEQSKRNKGSSLGPVPDDSPHVGGNSSDSEVGNKSHVSPALKPTEMMYHNGRAETSSKHSGEGENHNGATEIDDKASFLNPLASMVAAAALARNKSFGFQEQSFENISDTCEEISYE